MPNENIEQTTPSIEELIPQLITALQAVTEKVDEIAARQDELDSVLYDGLIGPANEALAQQEYDNALSDFRAKYAEKLGPFEGPSKAIEGDDFDVFKTAFDNYNEGDYGEVSPDEYVDQLAANLTEQIAKIKEAVADEVGVSPDQVEVDVSAEDGEVTVDVDDTTTEEQPEENVSETTTSEEVVPKESEEAIEEATTEAEPETTTEEESLDDFEKSLREEIEKNPPKIKY